MPCLGLLATLAALALPGVANASDYGATAAGINGDRVGVGYADHYSTQEAADARALDECGKRTGNCKITFRFRNGACGYITTAVTGGICYGFGSTPARARTGCQAGGCGPCQTPIGGCTRP